MNSVLVKTWHQFKQQSAYFIIDAKKTKILPLSPPDNDTNTHVCLAATQTQLGKKS